MYRLAAVAGVDSTDVGCGQVEGHAEVPSTGDRQAQDRGGTLARSEIQSLVRKVRCSFCGAAIQPLEHGRWNHTTARPGGLAAGNVAGPGDLVESLGVNVVI